MYQNIFMKCLSLYSTDIIQNHRWHCISLWIRDARQKYVYFLRPKNWLKINPNTIIYVKTTTIDQNNNCYACFKRRYFPLSANTSSFKVLIYGIAIINIILNIIIAGLFFSCHHQYPFNPYSYFDALTFLPFFF